MIRLCGERVAQRHGRGHLLGFVLPLLLSLFYIGLPGCILSPSERLSSATNSGYFSIQPSVITSVYGFAEAKLDGFHSSEKSSDRYDQGHPIQLVAPDASHTKFILREEGIRFLQSLPPPITIVSAMGSIHTGKSFLLNQIMGQTSGFELGYTIDPGTSGIWVWSKPMTAYASHYGSRSFSSQAEPDNVSIVLMDTEGFHGPNVTKTYDQTLYAISSLLSSEVLFVSMKMMDSRDLEYLEELTKGANLFALRAYAKSLSTTLEDTTQAQNKIFHWTQDVSKQSAPFADVQTVQTHLQKHGYSAQIVDSLTPSSLTWVVQDFIQDLEGKTPLEWLNNLVDTIARSTPIDRVESAEISKSGSYDHKHTADVTPTRKNSHSLREMYETIDSITLSAPAPVEKMQRLDCLSNKEISSDYLKELDVFRRRLFERALRIYKSRRDSRASILQNSFDTIHGSDMLSGADLADILRFLVRAANQNYFGDIDVFMDQFLQVRADVTKNDLKKLHEAAMSSYLESSPPPLLTEVSFYMKELFERTLSMWKQHVLGDSEKDWAQSTQESLEQLLISVEDEYYHKAEDSIRHYCRTHSRRIHQQDENAVAEKRTFLPSINRSINALKAAINTENRDYTDTTMCMEELQSYSKHTQDLYEELRRENNAAITTRYDSAAKVAIDKFYALVHDPKNALILRSKYKDFEETLFSWKLRAISEFKSYADELVAMEAETSEAEQKLNFQLREPEDTAKKLWEKECERHCNEIANRRTNALRKNVVDSLIFPVEETELKHAVETFLADTENEMRELYCDGSPVWKAKARDLESELRVIHASLENENVEATKRYFKEPLEHVTLALQLDVEICWHIPSCCWCDCFPLLPLGSAWLDMLCSRTLFLTGNQNSF
ncbi:guanylate-binding protein, N-terminal domain-containing protein [Cardiosporidium cionae]|uniref:Guanylate-binding protein, N-terminal domain-containing protein n=1 Tax=Cardiosporidium cionae TaxID=476202 RepID=A0ABQ7J727_9APIC|nr:guanylate-binding protein, N-terminal domain-containing protein [Cardiosporidium cionae]|eukprot:KAF8819792.1 guanylate-binding protein, N-terminal domain-containing protein [Cardiosporidium cionae]